MPKQIGYIVGSLRKDSINRKLANALIKLGPPDFTFKELKIATCRVQPGDDSAGRRCTAQERLAPWTRHFFTPNKPLDSGVAQDMHSTMLATYGRAPGRQTAGVIGASVGAIAPRWAVHSNHPGVSRHATLGQPEPTFR